MQQLVVGGIKRESPFIGAEGLLVGGCSTGTEISRKTSPKRSARPDFTHTRTTGLSGMCGNYFQIWGWPMTSEILMEKYIPMEREMDVVDNEWTMMMS